MCEQSINYYGIYDEKKIEDAVFSGGELHVKAYEGMYIEEIDLVISIIKNNETIYKLTVRDDVGSVIKDEETILYAARRIIFDGTKITKFYLDSIETMDLEKKYDNYVIEKQED